MLTQVSSTLDLDTELVTMDIPIGLAIGTGGKCTRCS